VAIIDNFSSHKSKIVKQAAKDLEIYFVYLPPYSPDLNPIEFIWKSIKRVLSTSFVPDLEEMEHIIRESYCRFASFKSYADYWIKKFISNNTNYKTYANDYNTKNPQIIEALIWVAILTLLVSRRTYYNVRKFHARKNIIRFTQLRWSIVFAENADDQLTLILRYLGITKTLETILGVYDSQALDPHVNRERFRAEWWA
jgi:transposase